MNTTKLFELKKIQTEFPTVKINSAKDGADFIRNFYGDDLEVFESFFILLLNRQNKTIGYAKISQGGITGTLVDVKLVAKYCVESLASGVILAHNHPSGNLSPSEADKQITKKTVSALNLLDVSVIDHLILTADGFTSFAQEGLLDY
jgi:DNA repair protein RadC